MEKYIKTLESQGLNDFLQETLAWFNIASGKWFPTTKNCLSFQICAVSERIVVQVSYYNGLFSEYAETKNGGKWSLSWAITVGLFKNFGNLYKMHFGKTKICSLCSSIPLAHSNSLCFDTFWKLRHGDT